METKDTRSQMVEQIEKTIEAFTKPHKRVKAGPGPRGPGDAHSPLQPSRQLPPSAEDLKDIHPCKKCHTIHVGDDYDFCRKPTYISVSEETPEASLDQAYLVGSLPAVEDVNGVRLQGK